MTPTPIEIGIIATLIGVTVIIAAPMVLQWMILTQWF